MPESFLPDLIVAMIATVSGAALTVLIAVGAYRHEVRVRERDAIRHLANVLASRRALVPTTPVRVDTSELAHAEDLEACRRSVAHAREAIVETSRAVRPGSSSHESLDSMARATNRFLTMSRTDPDGYWIQLNALRSQLNASVIELSHIARQELPEPGSRGRLVPSGV